MIRNQSSTQNVLEAIETLHEAGISLVAQWGGKAAVTIGADMVQLLNLISIFFYSFSKEGSELAWLDAAAKSLTDSLNMILKNMTGPLSAKALKELDVTFLALLEETYMQFYFWGLVYPERKRMEYYYTNEMPLLAMCHGIDDAIVSGNYHYELSIIVVAYNKLEYTKICIDNLLKNIPQGLKYELILVDHGSTDGTSAYFESLKPDKLISISNNGSLMPAFQRRVEGRYYLLVSNDVVVTPSAIENMLQCIRSDERISYVVPTTPNISNLQTIQIGAYHTLDEMIVAAEKNNHLDPWRWEERVRLCNPLFLGRTATLLSENSVHVNGYLRKYPHAFSDDLISLLCRRRGYKNILAKDAYCYHFGSVTIKDDMAKQNEAQVYMEGRKEFAEQFGVDPWGTGFCYDPVFANRIVGDEQGHIDILGVNCGLGSNSLKIKEQIKEYCHNLDCTLSNITDDPRFLPDLKGIGEEAVAIDSRPMLENFLGTRTFHFIVWETPFLFGREHFRSLLNRFTQALNPGGRILLKATEQNIAYFKQSKKGLKWKEMGNQWFIARI